MRAPADVATFELLPFSATPPYEASAEETTKDKRSVIAIRHDGRKRSGFYRMFRRICFYLPLVVSFVPVILLLASSPHLSRILGVNGCLPNGDFVLPYTRSIWDSSQFFGITIAFTGPQAAECSSSVGILGSAQSVSQACTGYDFTTVKIIDVAFDVLVGRGGQLVLAAIAYRLFSSVLTHIMERGEVGYDMFSAVAFESGSLASMPTLLKHALGSTPIPRTPRSRWLYFSMSLGTLYIVAMPTLVSAMSGYSSYFVPYVSNTTVYYQENRELPLNHTQDVVDCAGSLKPVWGMLLNRPVVNSSNDGSYNFQLGQLIDDSDSATWSDYVQRYHAVYEACGSQNFTQCPAAQIDTEMEYYGTTYTLRPPVTHIEYWPDREGNFSHWNCGSEIVLSDWLDADGYSSADGRSFIRSAGFCMAGQNYVWGFSFILVLIVSILNLAFTLLMYGTWANVRSHALGKPESSHSLFYDATFMVTSAQAQHGDEIGDWAAKTLEQEIVKGKKGLSLQKTTSLRRRRSHTELGDPRGGDWGGHVIS